MENKIIKLIKKKDHRGIDYIVDLYSDKISYIVNSILNGYSNKEDIEECISDVFISVYNDIHTYDNKKGKFEIIDVIPENINDYKLILQYIVEHFNKSNTKSNY